MSKWLVLALLLVACSGEAELEAPMLGDCNKCGTAPISGGSNSGFPEGGALDAASTFDAADFDAVLTSDTAPDGLDIVDVLAPFPVTD
jgi:hypothetical protein